MSYDKEKHRTTFQIRNILKYNRDGSPNRQTTRMRHLEMFVNQLQKRGYNTRWDIHRIGQREVFKVVNDWRSRGISHRAIENRMADIRWLASKLGKSSEIPTSRKLGIPKRCKTPGWGENKAKPLDLSLLQGLDERYQIITLLRAEFGLRNAEACKFSHAYAIADNAEHIRLKGSWCKGGRPRKIALRTPKQRELINQVGKFQRQNGDRSMIPHDLKFTSFRAKYYAATNAAGIPGHGLRHAWAQQLFETISGFPAPHAGGPAYSNLDLSSKKRWDKAARIVNRELGHGAGRLDVTANYIGKRE